MSNSVEFSSLGLPESLLSALAAMGFTSPTPIQAQAIPFMLDGHDILGEAATGTGKTAAFGLPALAGIDPRQRAAQMLVLAPTRELAIQVATALEEFAVNMKGLRVTTLYGGQPYGPQLRDLERGTQVVVATPGRLMDHIRRGSIELDSIQCCVLDEADEMLNMGFLEDIEWILEHLPDQTQMALFSATMPTQIRRIAERFLKDPKHVKIASDRTQKSNIVQKAWKVSGLNKLTALERLSETLDYDAMIVFVRTRNDTMELANHLNNMGFKAAALNGDMSQQQREHTVAQLHKGKINILIATDVVARGLDVPRITHVLNFDLPMDSESYVHRIGRTGRAGRSGEAILFARPRELRQLRFYERSTGGTIEMMDMPTAEELGKHRVAKLSIELAECVAQTDLAEMTGMLQEMAEQNELSMEQLAAALLFQRQRSKPLKPKADPAPRFERERGERGDRGERGERGERRERKPRPDIQWDTYRLEVGREHGTQVKDIVGAIANEIQLESNYIGQIRLHDAHSLVQLPAAMPADVLTKLKSVTVRSRPLSAERTNEVIEPRPRREGGRDGGRDDRRGGFRGEGRRRDGESNFRGRRDGDSNFRGRRDGDSNFRGRRDRDGDNSFRGRRDRDGEGHRGRRRDGDSFGNR
ncbi:DEAD/DEAH box helicase [Ferrimonas balearica]|uniref:DEAD/DEAH box helicase n=1 Tax=Ferrimonas balearica TaxID=44012 RepID=UPI001C98F185|nr:DEAD/DEAH box helicase [Ferrimonas balearica]MBY5921784.1 DEAD/DEAH box helicase [Ferrimonas balearica]MBY5994876.1 DEAD/DEAH box helicase [Ferrimonas balearica]